MANKNNGNRRTAADIEILATNLEENLEFVDKVFIKKMLNTLNSIMVIAQRKEKGIFNVILKWFRLYLKLYTGINPYDKKLLKYYENSALTIITYIIGCLQYNAKELPNYHYNLLDILEELLETIQPSVLKNISKFGKGTIGCLWHSIDLAGDFNTQLKALKILSILLRQFDEDRQNEELRCIKWTHLNLFQDKLKTIVQETKLCHILENSSRDLLNSYNMNLSKNIMVYSFFCKSLILGNKYKFYKPVNMQKFWIDINYRPKTVSYYGRFKLTSNSMYENISVVLKIKKMILKKNILELNFTEPCNFSKYSNHFSNIEDNVISFTLTNEEKQRLLDNDFIIEYFKRLEETNSIQLAETNEDAFDLLKNGVSSILQEVDVRSPITARNVENITNKHPIRKLNSKKKFFTSLIMEQSDELINKNTQKKRNQNQKPRKAKLRCKQVCKVVPSVDLTKMDDMDTKNPNELHTVSSVEIPLNNNISKNSSPLITTQKITDVYEVGETTYAKPCQSYRNFKTQLNPTQKTFSIENNTKAKSRKKGINSEIEPIAEKKRKLINCYSQENKENVNPKTYIIDKNPNPLPVTKSIIPPHSLETQCSDRAALNKLSVTVEKEKSTFDLTLDENKPTSCWEQNGNRDDIINESISSSDSLECEEVRGLNETFFKVIEHNYSSPTKTILSNSNDVTTPRPTSSMNISNLNDSDMEITQVSNCQVRKMEEQVNKYDINAITLENVKSDMALIKSKNANFITEQCFENDYRNKQDLERDLNVLKEINKVPDSLQQILNDFDYSSDNESNLSYENPNNTTNCDITSTHVICNYPPYRRCHRECIIFQNRLDMEESDESSNCDEFASTSNNNIISRNRNLSIMQNVPLALKQNLCDKADICTTPDKNKNISTSTISRMATTCEVTPTAIIMHQLQVSAKKSIILKDKYNTKMKKHFKSNKCLDDFFINKNTLALQSKHLKNSNDVSSAETLRVYRANGEKLVPQELNASYTNSSESENISSNSSAQNTTYQGSSMENSETLLKNDFLRIISEYNKNMKERLDNVFGLGLKNISDMYTHKLLEVLKAVLKKFDEHKMELNQIRANISRLVRELEWQYDAFMNKSKEFDIHREITEIVLKTITDIDASNNIIKDYEDIFQQLNIEQNAVFQKIWRKYLENGKI